MKKIIIGRNVDARNDFPPFILIICIFLFFFFCVSYLPLLVVIPYLLHLTLLWFSSSSFSFSFFLPSCYLVWKLYRSPLYSSRWHFSFLSTVMVAVFCLFFPVSFCRILICSFFVTCLYYSFLILSQWTYLSVIMVAV